MHGSATESMNSRYTWLLKWLPIAADYRSAIYLHALITNLDGAEKRDTELRYNFES
jgi:hypothetical protein